MNSRIPTRLADTVGSGPLVNAALIRSMSSVPTAWYSRNMPSRKPASPTRFVMNAFLPARALSASSNQKPMRR
jgi:hypothetical protein